MSCTRQERSPCQGSKGQQHVREPSPVVVNDPFPGLGELLRAAGLAGAHTLAFHILGTVLLYKLLAISSS